MTILNKKTLLVVSYITLLQLKERKSIVSTVDTQIKNIASATKEQQRQVLPKLGAKKHQIKALDKIDLSDLTPKKTTAVPKLLIEEAAEAVVKRCSLKITLIQISQEPNIIFIQTKILIYITSGFILQ